MLAPGDMTLEWAEEADETPLAAWDERVPVPPPPQTPAFASVIGRTTNQAAVLRARNARSPESGRRAAPETGTELPVAAAVVLPVPGSSVATAASEAPPEAAGEQNRGLANP